MIIGGSGFVGATWSRCHSKPVSVVEKAIRTYPEGKEWDEFPALGRSSQAKGLEAKDKVAHPSKGGCAGRSCYEI